ncbi:hypothetical protein [Brevibacillus laterosporus]|uniref:Uncharacterized protein n=1 Tax=Brevibacillus laterosporus TaxID=1465 RepID=A0AAP8U795_BRELA|nr:hypothetical protein [Brevibacillus laterosporus]PPB12974.1 hypothetical protein C4A77_00895 [Brevibacillus laterosporus]
MERYVPILQYVNATQVNTNFTLCDQSRCFIGKTGDYIISENGQQYVFPKHVFEKFFKKSTIADSLLQVDHEQAYREMYNDTSLEKV